MREYTINTAAILTCEGSEEVEEVRVVVHGDRLQLQNQRKHRSPANTHRNEQQRAAAGAEGAAAT